MQIDTLIGGQRSRQGAAYKTRRSAQDDFLLLVCHEAQ
jgi:hypothetical protein